MKKILLSLAIITTSGINAQSYNTVPDFWYQTTPRWKILTGFTSISYGGANTLGVDMMLNKIGFGLSLGMNAPAGEDYSNTMGPNAFREDIYKISNEKTVSARLIIGDNITDKFKLAGMLGIGETRDFFHAYDKQQILSPSGYYYTSANGKTSTLFGFLINYRVNKDNDKGNFVWGIHIGYNNFDNFNAGLSVNL
jgi:hypothetical protein